MINKVMFWSGVLSVSMTALIWPPHKMLTTTISAIPSGSAVHDGSADAVQTAALPGSTQPSRQFVAVAAPAREQRHGMQHRFLSLSRQLQALNDELAAARQDVMVGQRRLADRKRQLAVAARPGSKRRDKIAAAVPPQTTVKQDTAKQNAVAKPKAARPKAKRSPAVTTAAPSKSGHGHVEIHTGAIVSPTSADAPVKGKTWKDFLVQSKPRPGAKPAAATSASAGIGHTPLPSRHSRIALARKELARIALAPQPYQRGPQYVARSLTIVQPVLSRRVLVLALQEMLQVIGCTPGPQDGKWGRKGQDAMERAYDSTGIGLDSAVADVAALKALSGLSGRICLRSCNAGEILQRGSCVRKPKPKIIVEAPAPAVAQRRPQQVDTAAAPEPPPPEPVSNWTTEIFGINN